MPETDFGSRILLDTHALLWWLAGSERLSPDAQGAIEHASHIAISPISFWEVSMLQNKGRIELAKPTRMWVNDLLSMPRIRTAQLSATCAVDAGELPEFHGDPADRIIYVTAVLEQLALVTKDEKLIGYASASGSIRTIW